MFQIRPTRFGETYGKAAQASRMVDVLLNANLVEITTDATGRTATEAGAVTLSGSAFRVRADAFVLAAGGRARLEWKISDQDLESIQRTQTQLADALGDASMEMFPFRTNGRPGWIDAIAGGAHHMGTTRMHRDPQRGVVDEQCGVHGTSNLYVAGSSVFPTGGWAPPMLTIVALALRLADHLAGCRTGRC